ncbi:DUF2971 domain-containing protein [Paraburkholderia denitrificans]|uniref:DUF2971 domain-containing protein n=1 Tax=Paraburkholderia denitrificans TaxID=694025 RepID=A0ABW0J3M0_9BURK
MSELKADAAATFDLFKFRRVSDRLIDSLKASTLWCASPASLNDPFDCQLDIRASLVLATAKATGTHKRWLQSALDNPKFLDDWKTLFAQVGVCSFSLDLYNSLMWAHYADEHKGVCLLYRLTEQFINDPANEIIGIDKVRYEANGLTDWLVNEPPKEFFEFRAKLTELYLTAKAPNWSYEKELRIIRFKHGIFNVPAKSLIQVCFGLRTSEADIDSIREVATKYCGCERFCKIVRDEETDFGIKAVEL